MKRLCFLSPTVARTEQLVADFIADGIPKKHIYVVAKHGVQLGDLPDAGPESDDFLPAYERGLVLGGSAGLLAGLVAISFPVTGVILGGGAVLLFSLFGAGLGGVLTGLAGAAFSNSHLEKFSEAINNGQIIVIIDVAKDQVDHFKNLVLQFEPDIKILGVEPPTTLIPH